MKSKKLRQILAKTVAFCLVMVSVFSISALTAEAASAWDAWTDKPFNSAGWDGSEPLPYEIDFKGDDGAEYRSLGDGTAMLTMHQEQGGTIKVNTVTDDYGYTYKVIWIGAGALSSNPNVTKIVLGDNVRIIGYWAFANDPKLKSVTFGKNVTFCGVSAFGSGGSEDSSSNVKKIVIKSTKLTKEAKIDNVYEETGIWQDSFAGVNKNCQFVINSKAYTKTKKAIQKYGGAGQGVKFTKKAF